MQFIIKLKTGSKEFNKSTRFTVSVMASRGMLVAGESCLSWLQGHTEPDLLCCTTAELESQGLQTGHRDVSQTGGKGDYCMDRGKALNAACTLPTTPLTAAQLPRAPWQSSALASQLVRAD